MAGRQSEAARAAARNPAARSVRERLGEDLAEEYELLKATIREGAQATKRVRIADQPCPKCDCKHIRYVEVQDTMAALKAAEFWTNQGLGRPGEDRGESSSDFVVRRYVVEPGEEDDAGGSVGLPSDPAAGGV